MKARPLFGRSPLLGVSVKREFTVSCYLSCTFVPSTEQRYKECVRCVRYPPRSTYEGLSGSVNESPLVY